MEIVGRRKEAEWHHVQKGDGKMRSVVLLMLLMSTDAFHGVSLILVIGYLTVKMPKHPQWLSGVAPY